MRTATIPQWWLVAVSRYPRLTRPEFAVLMALAAHTWDSDSPSPCVTISFPSWKKRVGVTRTQVIRAIMTLQTPAGATYQFAKNRKKLGHGMVHCYRVPEGTRGVNVYELDLQPERWGWDAEDRPKALALASTARDSSLLQQRFPPTVRGVAEQLRSYTDAIVLPHDDDMIWARWCSNIVGIIRRGYTPLDLSLAISAATDDPYWALKLRGPDADIVLRDHFEGFLLRGRGRNAKEADIQGR